MNHDYIGDPDGAISKTIHLTRPGKEQNARSGGKGNDNSANSNEGNKQSYEELLRLLDEAQRTSRGRVRKPAGVLKMALGGVESVVTKYQDDFITQASCSA
ncbi:uncharacterized protein LOC125372072 [Haliotis rufescens]|uniref:uncharacterized protein LOC125372072 n=1 Tax=Haliotis rufescens TaxID=6454 RepID=UPI00201F344C|nr:uncharacterized protein LOC125372072 [Haliotis rufescens]